MKNVKLVIGLAVLFLAGCAKDELPADSQVAETADTEVLSHHDVPFLSITGYTKPDLKKIEVTDSGVVDCGKDGQQSRVIRRINEDGDESKNVFYGYAYFSMRYESIDEYGNPITLSQLVAAPYSLGSYKTPNNICIGCHVTYTDNQERPSNYINNSYFSDVGFMVTHAMYGSSGSDSHCLVVVPDYEGYGASSDKFHPYIYEKLTARQVVDGVLAAKEWYEANKAKLNDGWQSFIEGYSQGGGVAMATHKYIEQNNLSSELNFAGSVCAGGPYDPVAMVQTYVSEDKVYMPVALAFMIKGLCETNPYVAPNYTVQDYVSKAFYDTGMFDWLEENVYTTDDIADKLYDSGYPVIGSSDDYYCTLSDMVADGFMEYFAGYPDTRGTNDKYDKLADALEMNRVIKDWELEHPMIAFHSTRDEVVPFVNYQNASKFFADSPYFKGLQYQAGSVYLHVGTGNSFYAYYETYYCQKILSEEWKGMDHDGWETGKIFTRRK